MPSSEWRRLEDTTQKMSKDWLATVLPTLPALPTKEKESLNFEFATRIAASISLIFNYLNASILSGEYLSNSALVHGNLKKIAKDIDEINDANLALDEHFQDLDLYNFFKPIQTSVKKYEAFLSYIANSFYISSPESTTILFNHDIADVNTDFHDYLKTSRKYNRTNKPTLEQWENLFLINLVIAEYDHSMPVDSALLGSLLQLEHEFDNQQYKTIKYGDLVHDKCKFLIRKICHRISRDGRHYSYYHDQRERGLRLDAFPIEFFKEFDDTTSIHYGKDTREQSLRFLKYGEKLSETSTFLHYHAAVKYYKDIENDLTTLGTINTIFKKKSIDEQAQEFDKYSYRINRNYIVNNELSLLSQQFLDGSIPIRMIEEKIEEIDQIQQETGIKNYFPYLKVATTLSDKFRQLMLENTSDIERAKIQEAKGILALAKKWINVAQDNFGEYKERGLKTFQLPINESYIRILYRDEEFSLFSASSFVLPFDYEAIRLEIEKRNKVIEKQHFEWAIADVTCKLKEQESRVVGEIQAKSKDIIRNMETKFTEKETEIHDQIATSNKEVSDKVEAAKTEVSNSKTEFVSILSIFAAIAFFTSGSIQVLSKPLEIDVAIAFIAALATAFTLFVLLIWFVLGKGEFEKKRHGWVLVSLILSLGVMVVTLIYAHKDTQGTIRNAISTEIQNKDTLIRRLIQEEISDSLDVIRRQPISPEK